MICVDSSLHKQFVLQANTFYYTTRKIFKFFFSNLGNSLTPGYDRAKMPSAVLKPLNQEAMEMLEYPFLTLTKVFALCFLSQ